MRHGEAEWQLPTQRGRAEGGANPESPKFYFEKTEKVLGAAVSSLGWAGCVPLFWWSCVVVACLCPLALNNNNNYKGQRVFGAGMA